MSSFKVFVYAYPSLNLTLLTPLSVIHTASNMYAQYNICQIWYVICIICTWYVLTHKMNTFLGNLGSTYLFLYIVSWPKSTKTTRMRPKRASMTLYNSKYILITKEFRLIELWFLIIRKRAWVFCSIQGEFRGWTVPNRIKVSLSGQNCCGRRGGFTFFDELILVARKLHEKWEYTTHTSSIV